MGEISKVYVVFKTHLDIGFTDFAASVRRQYRDSFVPAAMRIARQQRESGSAERFIWTTGSWLIYEYLETATSARRRQMGRPSTTAISPGTACHSPQPVQQYVGDEFPNVV